MRRPIWFIERDADFASNDAPDRLQTHSGSRCDISVGRRARRLVDGFPRASRAASAIESFRAQRRCAGWSPALIEGVRLLRTALAVRDLDRSVAFYRRLGFEERARTQVGEAAVIAVMGLAGEPNRLQLTQPLGSAPPPAGGSYLVVEVSDLDAARHELARSSIEPTLVPPPDIEHGTRTAVFRDPDGHGVELMQRTRGGGARAGAA